MQPQHTFLLTDLKLAKDNTDIPSCLTLIIGNSVLLAI